MGHPRLSWLETQKYFRIDRLASIASTEIPTKLPGNHLFHGWASAFHQFISFGYEVTAVCTYVTAEGFSSSVIPFRYAALRPIGKSSVLD